MSMTKLSPNWACQIGPIHFIKFLLSGYDCMLQESNLTVNERCGNAVLMHSNSMIELSKWRWGSRFFVVGGSREEVGVEFFSPHGVEKEVGVEFCHQL